MAKNKAISDATVLINESVIFELENGDYSGLVDIETDNNGKIVSASANPIVTNKLKSKLSLEIAKRLSKLSGEKIAVPLGNAFGSAVFSGKGPLINVKIISVGEITSNFENTFETEAINQTLHRMMMNVSLSITLYVPFSLETVPINTSVCISEKVLVGEVPDAYTYVVEGSSGIAGALNDYGATIP